MKETLIFSAVSNSVIEELLKRAFGPQIRLDSQQLLTGGDFNTSYKVELCGFDEPVALRIAPESHHPLFSFERNIMKREKIISAELRSADVKVPKVLFFGSRSGQFPRDFLVSEYIQGQTLSNVNLTRAQWRRIYNQINIEVTKMRNVQRDWFGWAGQDLVQFETWADFLISIVQEIRVRNYEYNIFSEYIIDRVHSSLIESRYCALADKRSVLLHNDLHAGNIIVDDTLSLCAIVDVDRSFFGVDEFEFSTSNLVRESFLKRQKKWSGAASMYKRIIYEIVLNMFDADVCLTQLGRVETSKRLQECVARQIDDLYM